MALIIVHDHTGADPSPSRPDIALPRELLDAARHLKISVHGHVIVGATGQSGPRSLNLV